MKMLMKTSKPLFASFLVFVGLAASFVGYNAFQTSRNSEFGGASAATKILTHFNITRNGTTLWVPTYVSQSLTTPDTSIRRAVIVIHGVSRNAVDYFDYASINTGGVAGMVTIAPRFATSADAPAAGQLYWTSTWSECGQSVSSLAWRLSSCAVLDELIASLYKNYANLNSVVIMGNSAGGQITTRYAAASPDTRNRYIVSAPSSYMYYTPQRWLKSSNTWGLPSGCSTYNDYKHGLSNLSSNLYMNAVGAAALKSHYQLARITFIIGSLDNDPNDPELDTSCEGMAQGGQRLERMQNWYKYLGYIFGASIYANKNMEIVDGYAHSARNVLGSAQAKSAIMEGFNVTTSALGDLNKDGAINVFDLSMMLGKWGTADPTCDINKDGTVNVFDMSYLLSHWS